MCTPVELLTICRAGVLSVATSFRLVSHPFDLKLHAGDTYAYCHTSVWTVVRHITPEVDVVVVWNSLTS